MIDYSKSFSYMFEDKEWAGKIFLGAVFNLLSLVLIGIPFVLGYLLELAKNTSEGKETPLPQWDKLGEKFLRGLIFLIIIIIYCIPSTILYKLPCSGKCLSPLYSLALLFVMPWITLRYATSGKFEEVFRFKEMFQFVQKNINSLVILVLLSLAFGLLALFGILALIVGIFFTAFWADLAIYYLYGKIYGEGKDENGNITASASGLPPSIP
jgi:hypothetical protein